MRKQRALRHTDTLCVMVFSTGRAMALPATSTCRRPGSATQTVGWLTSWGQGRLSPPPRGRDGLVPPVLDRECLLQPGIGHDTSHMGNFLFLDPKQPKQQSPEAAQNGPCPGLGWQPPGWPVATPAKNERTPPGSNASCGTETQRALWALKLPSPNVYLCGIGLNSPAQPNDINAAPGRTNPFCTIDCLWGKRSESIYSYIISYMC